jgi:chorismate synthase
MEDDAVQILSGVEQGRTLGSPLALCIASQNTRPGDYTPLRSIPRPSHADFTTMAKYGIRAASGGGRASARETAARVAAGAVAEIVLKTFFPGLEIVAWVNTLGGIAAPLPDRETLSRALVDESPVRCPDPQASHDMVQKLDAAVAAQDSLGGTVSCICRGIPAGWGEPVFDKLTATLAHAMMSIPAARGFEIGDGFDAAQLAGSEHNDLFTSAAGGGIRPASNHSGGIQGGISNGEEVVFRVAFKPPASIGRPQPTVDENGQPVTLCIPGRHDPCVLARAVPVVEAMAALTLVDAFLLQRLQLSPPPSHEVSP